MTDLAHDMESLTPYEARMQIRAGRFSRQTGRLAPGYAQGNLAVIPERHAADFMRFCNANQSACPILGTTAVGSSLLPELGKDLDIASDLPKYWVWRNGKVVDESTDVSSVWRDDLVGFALGCSFLFEAALLDVGLDMVHRRENKPAPAYITSIQTTPAGPFRGPLVVSMRSFSPSDVVKACLISARFPMVHGAPIHVGRPDLLGIDDLSRPDYGEQVSVPEDHVPVFWACGVTPHAILADLDIDLCITHAPGHMLVTDRPSASYSIL